MQLFTHFPDKRTQGTEQFSSFLKLKKKSAIGFDPE